MSQQSKSSSISLSSASTLVISAATNDVVLGNKTMPYNLGQAIKLYTRATNNRHPVAFLNRSLCYMAINKPDLAAMDAQRAYCLATGTHAGYQDSKVSRQLYEYADVCERAGDDRAFWATVSPELVQTIGGPPSLVNFQLMKLTIRAEPSPDHLLRTNETFDAFDDLRAKALFRLALALFKCGGGAQRSAISILELSSLTCHSIGKGEFLWFGSKLTITLQNQFDQHRAMSGNTDDIGCLMASRYAFFDIGRYSARENDLEALNKSIQELDRCAAVALVDVEGEYTLTPTRDVYQGDVLFTEETILSVSTADTKDANAFCYCDTCCTMIEIADNIFERPPSPDLNVDAKVGEDDDGKGHEDDTRSLDEAAMMMMPPLASDPFLVVEGDQSPLNVSSTSISPEFSSLMLQKEDLTINTSSDGINSVKASSEDERPDEDDYTESAQHDSAAAEEHPEEVVTTPISEHSTDKVISSEDVVLSPPTDEGSIKVGVSASIVTPEPAAESRLPPPPPVHRTLPSRTKASKTTPELSFCDCCNRGLHWCSSECKALAFACHHTLLCGTDVEEVTRKTINVRSHPMTPTVHERSLTMLLLARILSWAQTEKQNVLENPAVKILSVAAFEVGRTDRKYTSWSYDTHVVAPLLILEAIDISRNQIAYDTRFADGQVINMLINLIEKHLDVEKTSRSYKKYDHNGNLDIEHSSGGKVGEAAEGGKDGTNEPASKLVYGRLRPLCGLLAKAPHRVRPKVELVDIGDNRIICIPFIDTSVTASKEASLRVGEPLYLASHTIRPGTYEERQKYQRNNYAGGSRPEPDSDTEENIEDTLEAYAAAEDDDDDMMDEEWNLSDENH